MGTTVSSTPLRPLEIIQFPWGKPQACHENSQMRLPLCWAFQPKIETRASRSGLSWIPPRPVFAHPPHSYMPWNSSSCGCSLGTLVVWVLLWVCCLTLTGSQSWQAQACQQCSWCCVSSVMCATDIWNIIFF